MKSLTQAIYPFRLVPGEDLKQSLLAFAARERLKAAYIITCVGSLQTAALRLAGATEQQRWEEKMEIVSLVGTLFDGGCHLHLSLSRGEMVGGHLLDGCTIYTTAEIVIGEAHGLLFSRELDSRTGYPELHILKAAP